MRLTSSISIFRKHSIKHWDCNLNVHFESRWNSWVWFYTCDRHHIYLLLKVPPNRSYIRLGTYIARKWLFGIENLPEKNSWDPLVLNIYQLNQIRTCCKSYHSKRYDRKYVKYRQHLRMIRYISYQNEILWRIIENIVLTLLDCYSW